MLVAGRAEKHIPAMPRTIREQWSPGSFLFWRGVPFKSSARPEFLDFVHSGKTILVAKKKFGLVVGQFAQEV